MGKIGIDANWLIYEKAGIGKYTNSLVRAILAEDKENEYVLYFNFFKNPRMRMAEIAAVVENAKANVSIEVSAFPAIIKELLTQVNFPINRIFKKQVDLFHAPFFSAVPKKGYPKIISTIHDLAFLEFPEHRGKKITRYYTKRTRQAIEKSEKLIAVSSATAKDLQYKMGVDPEKIEVVHEAADDIYFQKKDQKLTNRILKKYKIKDYILSVCTLEPRKNLTRLIKAYAMLPYPVQRKYKLVLTGQAGWNNGDIFTTIENLNLKDRVVFLGYVPQEDLPHLYQGAKIFAYPSLYEGFGLPVLEAMASGAPVLTSDISSLPEITEKSAYLVNPYDEYQIHHGLQEILKSKTLENDLRQKALIQANKFSWKKAAKKTIKIYNEILNVKKRSLKKSC